MTMVFAEITPVAPVRPRTRQAVTEGGLALPRGRAADAGKLDPASMAGIATSAFRAHGHICNVMTHISGGHWDRVEDALRLILDPRAGRSDLTPLAENIVELLSADAGVTGRIVKPYFATLMARLLPADAAATLCAHLACLSVEAGARTGPVGRCGR
ncbi:hypothetical protein GN330_15695 [Nitratireductor sp. CAU 1489]|uniref:Uncharacterized protein n=1 Tax=Nitratireductor arenosus TaxID=2682096 RepID=A0A844QM34_9HYPH|nr:hypothetical protein [Nitratireductor arenosus]MVA98689.1 hypothetical protein [Nitratireductor arenosus]